MNTYILSIILMTYSLSCVINNILWILKEDGGINQFYLKISTGFFLLWTYNLSAIIVFIYASLTLN